MEFIFQPFLTRFKIKFAQQRTGPISGVAIEQVLKERVF